MPGKHTATITNAQIDAELDTYAAELQAAQQQRPGPSNMKGRRHYKAADAVVKAHRYAWRRNLAAQRAATTTYLEQVA